MKSGSRYAAPLSLAKTYAAQGAEWLHLVDLDAARAGGYTLLPLLAAIKAETSFSVQTGGGVRDEADVERLLAAGMIFSIPPVIFYLVMQRYIVQGVRLSGIKG